MTVLSDYATAKAAWDASKTRLAGVLAKMDADLLAIGPMIDPFADAGRIAQARVLVQGVYDLKASQLFAHESYLNVVAGKFQAIHDGKDDGKPFPPVPVGLDVQIQPKDQTTPPVPQPPMIIVGHQYMWNPDRFGAFGDHNPDGFRTTHLGRQLVKIGTAQGFGGAWEAEPLP